MLLYVWAAAILVGLYLYFRQAFAHFSKYGVKSESSVSVIGNLVDMIFLRRHFIDLICDIYNKYPEEKFVGMYEFTKPVVLIRDIELIKKITVKDFESFLDHREVVSEKIDPFFGRNLFSLKEQAWKDMRSTLSPAFTSSKMKQMLPFIVEVGDQMIISLNKKIKESKTGYIDIESRELATHYANDVIATCAFGLKVDTLSDPDNEFYKMGAKASNFGGLKALLKFMGFAVMPYIMKLANVTLFDEDVKKFFKHLVLSTMEDREARNILRPDMIHLLMEAKKGRLSHDDSVQDADAGFATVEESSVGKKTTNIVWSDVDLIAQALLFFIAGFDTVSTTMTFLMYELALHPEVQDKLVTEIREHEERSGGRFDYNSIQTMTYMDMVVSELLRRWAPVVVTDRLCIKDYNLGRPNKNATHDYIIKKGEGVQIPVAAMHRDPQYFPDPLKFDPERFSDENKHRIRPFTYMPFGLGPRNCIGSRFALCEVKVMVYQLLRHLELMPCERTRVPCELEPTEFNLRIKGGHWLRLKPRA